MEQLGPSSAFYMAAIGLSAALCPAWAQAFGCFYFVVASPCGCKGSLASGSAQLCLPPPPSCVDKVGKVSVASIFLSHAPPCSLEC